MIEWDDELAKKQRKIKEEIEMLWGVRREHGMLGTGHQPMESLHAKAQRSQPIHHRFRTK